MMVSDPFGVATVNVFEAASYFAIVPTTVRIVAAFAGAAPASDTSARIAATAARTVRRARKEKEVFISVCRSVC